MIAVLLLQTSLLVRPMYMQSEPPEGRAMRGLVVVHRDAPGAPAALARTREEALELAQSLERRIRAGEDFATLAREHSQHASARYGGILGTAWPGMFHPALDAFLFSAAVGESSAPIESSIGFHVQQRNERDAAWRSIQINGNDDRARARCRELLSRLQAGEDFAALALAESDDPPSAGRGGAVGVFQRGPRDALVKAAVFDLDLGAVAGPIETPFALYIVQRVRPADLDPALAEDLAARARAILIASHGATGAKSELRRTSEEARQMAEDLARRIRAGEDLAALAREWNDDPGGRERSGDLGWIRRGSSETPAFMDKLFLTPLGELIGPEPSRFGWVLVRRER